MHGTAHDEYLVTAVMTATPQKLHLMLLDAALRQCEATRQAWKNLNADAARTALVKAQDIVTELLASLNYGEHPELTARIAGVYRFIFQMLVAAHVHEDAKSLADATQLLEIERETWRQYVEKSPAVATAKRVDHTPHTVPAPVKFSDAATSSLSFEA
jgi:flagellar protein FliS